MGHYLNPSSIQFREILNSEIYVDKSELIAVTNEAMHTQQKYICVSRPRRFGKSLAAHMLAAIVELKWDNSTENAVKQIKERRFGNLLEEYQSTLLLVGINYDKKTKNHQCRIESI